MTCNIRVALPEDDAKGFGWTGRKDICARIIHQYKPDIIGLQEVLKVQMDDLRKSFPEMQAFGFDGPEMDPHPTGYYGIAKNPILFSQKRYELRGGGTFWLSDTPLIGGSKAWETARARHCNWVRLFDKATGKEFRVLNTHLDHIAQGAREKQIQTIIGEAGQYASNFPQILTGDLNSKIDNPVHNLLNVAGWTDTYVAANGNTDPGFTAHEFEGPAHAEALKAKNVTGGKIDYILTRGKANTIKSGIIKDQENGKYPSDHYFGYTDLVLL